jgi:hypothetical protein
VRRFRRVSGFVGAPTNERLFPKVRDGLRASLSPFRRVWIDTGTAHAEHIAAVVELYLVGERFVQAFHAAPGAPERAKNGPSAAGTSSRAEGPSTAGPAATTACNVPEASLGQTGGSALTESTP